MRALSILLLVCLAATSLHAQPTDEGYRAKIKRKVAAMRKAMREGKVQRYNVYVKVKLKNGNRVRGVVKSGRLVELRDGLDFVTSANVNNPRAGIRVWYTAGTNSYVFLRFQEILHYKIGRRLSYKQVKTLEAEIVKKRREAEENYRRLMDARGGDKKPETDGEDPDDGRASTEPELSEKQESLLIEFPPSQGWSQDKLNKLKLQRITVGKFPSKKEARFEKVFARWSEARQLMQKLEKAMKARKKAAEAEAAAAKRKKAAEAEAAAAKREKAESEKPDKGEKKPGA